VTSLAGSRIEERAEPVMLGILAWSDLPDLLQESAPALVSLDALRIR
jgi:hypothetical protein